MATRKFTLKLPPEDYEQLQQIATEEERGMSDVVRTAIKEYAAKRGRKLTGQVERGGKRSAEVNS